MTATGDAQNCTGHHRG